MVQNHGPWYHKKLAIIAFTNIIVLTLYMDNNNPFYILSTYINFFIVHTE